MSLGQRVDHEGVPLLSPGALVHVEVDLAERPVRPEQGLDRGRSSVVVPAGTVVGGQVRDVDGDGAAATTTKVVVVAAAVAVRTGIGVSSAVLLLPLEARRKRRFLPLRFRLASLLGPDSSAARIDGVAAVVVVAPPFQLAVLQLFPIAFVDLLFQGLDLPHLLQLLR